MHEHKDERGGGLKSPPHQESRRKSADIVLQTPIVFLFRIDEVQTANESFTCASLHP